MDSKCEWKECEVVTHKRFCSQRCRDRWQYSDPEWRAKKLSRNRIYNSTHPEVMSRAQKKWYDNGGKSVRDAWRKANRDRYNELVRQWRLNNPEKASASSRASCSKRRALLTEAGTFTLDEWTTLCQSFDFKCANPNCLSTDLTVDHVIPLSAGGANTIDNIQPLCRSCNSRKGVTTTDYRYTQQ